MIWGKKIAKQTQAVRSLPAVNRIALTGTPVENRLSELRSTMQFLNPGFLGSQAGFRRAFALTIERCQDEAATERLKGLVGSFVLQRVNTDPTVIQDLPDKQEMKAYGITQAPGVPDFQGLAARSFWAQMERVYDEVTRRALDVAFADADQKRA